MDKLFLVKGEVRITAYEGETAIANETNLVEAVDQAEAIRIFTQHYESKTDPYSIYYSASSVVAEEALKREKIEKRNTPT